MSFSDRNVSAIYAENDQHHIDLILLGIFRTLKWVFQGILYNCELGLWRAVSVPSFVISHFAMILDKSL